MAVNLLMMIMFAGLRRESCEECIAAWMLARVGQQQRAQQLIIVHDEDELWYGQSVCLTLAVSHRFYKRPSLICMMFPLIPTNFLPNVQKKSKWIYFDVKSRASERYLLPLRDTVKNPKSFIFRATHANDKIRLFALFWPLFLSSHRRCRFN